MNGTGDKLVTEKHCDTQVKMMTDKIDKIDKSVNDIKIAIASLPDDILQRADKRYAGKTTEKVVYGMVGLILSIVITALVYLVVSH